MRRKEGEKHEKDYVGFLVAMVMLSGCSQEVWFRPNTDKNRQETDKFVCREKALDLVRQEKIMLDEARKEYSKCLKNRGYILRNQDEVRDEKYGSFKY